MAGILLLGMFNAVPAQAADSAVITVNIPDYRVTTEGGTDYVDLPGGEALLDEEGRPLVPYFIHTIDYPEGQRVQEVVLKERSGLKTATGLKLPVVVHRPDPEVPVAMKPGWYPAEIFQWRVWDNPDGGTALVIAIYPFCYNADTTEVEFYQKYLFEVKSVTTTVKISNIVTDKEIYALHDRITIELFVNNSSPPRDVVISLTIMNSETAEVIDGLPLGLMKDLGGEASYNAVWDSGNAAAGDYLLEATLSDTSGTVLDSRRMGIIIRDTQDIPPASGQSQKHAGGIPIIYLGGGAGIIIVAITLVVIRQRKMNKRRAAGQHLEV
jgi:hypothetical protein